MHFTVRQRFTADVEAVEAALIDPAFLDELASLPQLGRPVLVDQHREGTTVRQRVRYAFVGDLSPAVRAVVSPERLTWIEESTMDRSRHLTTFRMLPDHYPNLLRCNGTFQLTSNTRGCTRDTAAELIVAVPIFARRVESAIVAGLTDHARREAEALDAWIRNTIGH